MTRPKDSDTTARLRAARLKASPVLARAHFHAIPRTRPAASGARPVARAAQAAAKPVFAKFKHAQSELETVWPDIVGETLAGMTCPERYQPGRGAADNGVLTVRVAGALALDLQHLSPQIIERVNAFFGYRAIARLKIVQGPLANAVKRSVRRVRSITPDEKRQLEAAAADVNDAGLRAALTRLGASVLGSEQ